MLKRMKKLVNHRKGNKNRNNEKQTNLSLYQDGGDQRVDSFISHDYEKTSVNFSETDSGYDGTINYCTDNDVNCFENNINYAENSIAYSENNINNNDNYTIDNNNHPGINILRSLTMVHADSSDSMSSGGHLDDITKCQNDEIIIRKDLMSPSISPRSNLAKISSESTNGLDCLTETSKKKKKRVKIRFYKKTKTNKENKEQSSNSRVPDKSVSKRYCKSTNDLSRFFHSDLQGESSSDISLATSPATLRPKKMKKRIPDSETTPNYFFKPDSSPLTPRPAKSKKDLNNNNNNNSNHNKLKRHSVSPSMSSNSSVTSMEALRENRRSVISCLDGYINNVNKNESNLSYSPNRLCCAIILRSVYQRREQQCRQQQQRHKHNKQHSPEINPLQCTRSSCDLTQRAEQHSTPTATTTTGSLQNLSNNNSAPSLKSDIIDNCGVDVSSQSPVTSRVVKFHQGSSDSDVSVFSEWEQDNNSSSKNVKNGLLSRTNVNNNVNSLKYKGLENINSIPAHKTHNCEIRSIDSNITNRYCDVNFNCSSNPVEENNDHYGTLGNDNNNNNQTESRKLFNNGIAISLPSAVLNVEIY